MCVCVLVRVYACPFVCVRLCVYVGGGELTSLNNVYIVNNCIFQCVRVN